MSLSDYLAFAPLSFVLVTVSVGVYRNYLIGINVGCGLICKIEGKGAS